MDLPIRFLSETEVILEDVARFRSLAPSERMMVICDLLAEGDYLIGRSPKSAWIDEDYEVQGRLKRANIKEFIARHAR